MGLRSLGRQPIIHFCWIYRDVLDESMVNKFNTQLSKSLLGRVLQRSALPWGRHRWVSHLAPAPVTWFKDAISLKSLPDRQATWIALPLDPELGPAWRLAVQILEGGGCAMSLLVSHTIADVNAVMIAVAESIAGRYLGHPFPAPHSRWSPAILIRDSLESLAALPHAWRALKTLSQKISRVSFPVLQSASSAMRVADNAQQSPVQVPTLHVTLEQSAFEKNASQLGVTGNVLVAAFALKLASLLGRMDSEGRIKLVLPVSDRFDGDLRGNALRAVTVLVDSQACRSDLKILQRTLRTEFQKLVRHGDDLTPLLPLLPYIPLWLARHLESVALGDDLTVACSLLGEFPSDLMSPCGAAEQLLLSPLERHTYAELVRQRGRLYVFSYCMQNKVHITVSGFAPSQVTNRDELAPFVRTALEDLGLIETGV